MTIFVCALALIVVAAFAVAAVIITRCTTISVIIRKDPDMATIKERLAALEATQADHADVLTGVAKATDVDAVAARVDAVESEIGTDPAPAAAPAAASADVVEPVAQPAPTYAPVA